MTSRQAALLQLLNDYPNELDAEALADLAVPRPRLTSAGAYLAWRSTYAANRREARADVTQDLAAMVKAGLVARLQPVAVTPEVRAHVARLAECYRAEWRTMTRFVGRTRAPTKAEAFALGAEAAVRNAAPHDSETFAAAVRLFLKAIKGPPKRNIVGSAPSGATKRAWAMLCDSGLVVPSSRRVLTPAGLDAVGRMRGCA